MADLKATTQRLREIDLNEVEHLQVVGRGSFGTVYKAFWEKKFVAIKYFEQESERNAFVIELKQLSRVSHPNIIALYGAGINGPHVFLVMEYAEGGSLYNFLHSKSKPYYSGSHAMSWARQCAEGVAYLHDMKPKPLIHRDLKPLNLLLVNKARNLKICDFGTVADKATLMTNNKGSAAWMAPEVFEGSNYTEKCDVFSWAVILWEILTREPPFKDIGLTYTIMWRVHKGHRPPLIEGCPKPIENLMTSCWDPNPSKRPAMDYVVKIMHTLCIFFPGENEPLNYTTSIDQQEEEEEDKPILNSYNSTKTKRSESDTSDNFIRQQNNMPYNHDNQLEKVQNWNSIPEKNQAIHKNYLYGSNTNQKDSSERILTLQNPKIPLKPLTVEVDPNAWDLNQEELRKYIQDLPKSQGTERLTVTETKPALSEAPPPEILLTDEDTSDSSSLDIDTMHLMLDPELQPEAPDPNSRISKEIFEEHKNMAKEYLKLETEIAYLSKQKSEILASMEPEQRKEKLELLQKLAEKESLLELQNCLRRQLSLAENSDQAQQTTSNQSNDGWVYLPSDE